MTLRTETGRWDPSSAIRHRLRKFIEHRCHQIEVFFECCVFAPLACSSWRCGGFLPLRRFLCLSYSCWFGWRCVGETSARSRRCRRLFVEELLQRMFSQRNPWWVCQKGHCACRVLRIRHGCLHVRAPDSCCAPVAFFIVPWYSRRLPDCDFLCL